MFLLLNLAEREGFEPSVTSIVSIGCKGIMSRSCLTIVGTVNIAAEKDLRTNHLYLPAQRIVYYNVIQTIEACGKDYGYPDHPY